MNDITIHVEGLDDVKKRLGTMSGKATSVMRMAINDTSKKARTDLRKGFGYRYALRTGEFNKKMQVKPASNSALTATITIKGSPITLSRFAMRKNTKRYGARAHVLMNTVLKELYLNGNKAFLVKMKNGHIGIFARVGKERMPIKNMYGPSVAAMAGKIYRNTNDAQASIEPKVQENLRKNIDRHIKRLLEGKK